MLAKVASIYFASVRAERPFGGPYLLPGIPLGSEPFLLPIGDRIQTEQGPYNQGSNGKRSRRRHLVLGEQIARDVVAEWTAHGVGMTPQCRPGIWVVRERVPLIREDGTPVVDSDYVPQWREATPEEKDVMWVEDLAAALSADRAYANMLFVQANGMAEDPRLIPFISPNARLGAKQYGMDAEWLKEDAATNVKPCPYCTKVIPGTAIKCPKCAEIVDVERYAVMESQKAAAMKNAKEALLRQAREAQPVA